MTKTQKGFWSCQFQKGKHLRPTKGKEKEADTHKLRRRRKLQKPQKVAILSIPKGKLTENDSAPTN